MHSKFRASIALCAVVGAISASGCAEERAPINRVQSNALKKSFFVGEKLSDPSDDPEFYSAATVIDVPYGVNHGLFSGLAGGLKRVKWEISENTLLARMSYETIQDVDGRGARTTNDGEVIAAFGIDKHFDIQRSYNPSTGEELNVVEENESDRPWYEREYMRVDWSENLIASSVFWDPMAQNAIGDDSYEVEKAAYYVEDPNHPDAPYFDADARYFDITNKLYVTPKTLTLDGLKLPTCFWNSVLVSGANSETGICEAAEIKIRMSFKRVPQEGDPDFSDYEPMNWDGARMDAFGAFFDTRKGYDDRYGVIDNNWYRFVQRYNIWQRSTTSQECGSDADCTAPGSSCNQFRRLCTIPYAQRETRTIAWHYHMNSDDALLFRQTERATTEWDVALRIAVQVARYVECKRTNTRSLAGTRWADFALESDDPAAVAAACQAAFPVDQGEEAELDKVQALLDCERQNGRGNCELDPNSVAAIEPMVVLCHNPVSETDHPACGDPGLETRVGDLRYHSVNVWPTPESSSPWGFGPSWADPLTGEIIQASINVYDSVTEIAAQRLVDEARWLNGELPTSDVTSGQYVRSWANFDHGRDAVVSPGAAFRLPLTEIDARLGSARNLTPDLLRRAAELQTQLDLKGAATQMRDYVRYNKLPAHLQPSNRAEFDARIEAVKNSKLESQLLGAMWAEAAHVDANAPINMSALELASPLRGLNAERLLQVEQQVERRLAERGMCMYRAPEPGGLPAFSQLLKRKFPDGADPERERRMWDYTRGRLHYGVILHEMGHTVGLRHNFTSSFDALNYRPQYWQLRTNNGTVTEPCTQPVSDGSSCVGPRYYDPLTPEEIEQSVETWAQTSVMDYAGESTQDWVGLGIYDYAAVRAFYADAVDVRNDDLRAVPNTPGGELRGLVDDPFSHWVFDTEGRSVHYSQWNNFFGLLRNCREAEMTPPANWDEAQDGVWDPVFDGEIVNGTICDRPPVDYVAWRDMVPDALPPGEIVGPTDPNSYTLRRAQDAEGRVRVPYMFNSDEFRDGWTASTMTRDLGADTYEQFSFWVNQYENRHIFDNFRRNRTAFSIVDAYARALNRFHYKLGYLTQGTSFYTDFFLGELAENTGRSKGEWLAAFMGEGGPLREEAIAASIAFDHFMRVLTRPDVGQHYSTVPGYRNMLASGDRFGFTPIPLVVPTIIPNGTALSPNGDVTFGGRPLTNAFQSGKGYHYYDYLDHIGSFYEKTFVFQAMLNATYRAPTGFFREDGLDGRWRHTNFANIFPEGIRRALGAMLTEDWELFAPRLALDEQGNIEGVRENRDGTPALYPTRPMAWASYVNAAGPELCWPTSGQYLCDSLEGTSFPDQVPAGSIPVEPQVGYETQKFALFWAYVYMPSSQVMDFADMMRIYKTGSDVDSGILPEQRVSFRDPETGLLYTAKRFGDEELFGKTYDKGIAAKMIQWANTLVQRAYQVDATEPVDPVTGEVRVLLDANGRPLVAPDPTIAATNPDALTCDDNRWCGQLRDYRALLDFARDMAITVGFPPPDTGTY